MSAIIAHTSVCGRQHDPDAVAVLRPLTSSEPETWIWTRSRKYLRHDSATESISSSLSWVLEFSSQSWSTQFTDVTCTEAPDDVRTCELWPPSKRRICSTWEDTERTNTAHTGRTMTSEETFVIRSVVHVTNNLYQEYCIDHIAYSSLRCAAAIHGPSPLRQGMSVFDDFDGEAATTSSWTMIIGCVTTEWRSSNCMLNDSCLTSVSMHLLFLLSSFSSPVVHHPGFCRACLTLFSLFVSLHVTHNDSCPYVVSRSSWSLRVGYKGWFWEVVLRRDFEVRFWGVVVRSDSDGDSEGWLW